MFFFYSSGAHRYLHVLTHSFPSRRSSDVMQHRLMVSTVAGWSALVGILFGGHTCLFVLAAALAGLFGGLLVALGPVVARVGMTSMIVLVVTADRKSTRLNSSH